MPKTPKVQYSKDFENRHRNMPHQKVTEHFDMLYQVWKAFHDTETININDHEVDLPVVTPQNQDQHLIEQVIDLPVVTPQIQDQDVIKKVSDSQEQDIFMDASLNFSSSVPEPSSSKQVTSSVESLVSGATVQLPSPIIVKKKCSLGAFLAYPETPIRKGKRQTERQPYAISSQNFKAALHSKQKEKENLLKVKEDKKLIKEKKKAEKTNAKIKKIDKNSNANTKNENHTLISTSENANSKEIDTTLGKNSQQIIEHSEQSLEPISKKIKKEMHIKNKGAEEIRASKKITVLSNIVVQPANFVASPTCGVCHLNVIKNELPCSVCSKIFHVRCIPRKHKEHIPDSSDLHLFLCHLCFKVDDSVSGDSDSSTSAKEIFDIVNKAKRNLF